MQICCWQWSMAAAAGLDSLWQRLRPLVITQLWDAYCRARSRPEQPTQAAHIAARVISAARSQMRPETGFLSAQTFGSRAGGLSHWLAAPPWVESSKSLLLGRLHLAILAVPFPAFFSLFRLGERNVTCYIIPGRLHPVPVDRGGPLP